MAFQNVFQIGCSSETVPVQKDNKNNKSDTKQQHGKFSLQLALNQMTCEGNCHKIRDRCLCHSLSLCISSNCRFSDAQKHGWLITVAYEKCIKTLWSAGKSLITLSLILKPIDHHAIILFSDSQTRLTNHMKEFFQDMLVPRNKNCLIN